MFKDIAQTFSPPPAMPSAASLPHREKGVSGAIFALALLFFAPSPAHAALNIPITVNLSESVNVTGTPQIAVDVGGTTRYATYTSGTSTNALTFTLAPQAGDVDLDGVTVSSPIQLNGGTIKDSKGNNATLTFTPPNTANVKVNYPSLGMDFVYDADGRYTLNGTPYNDLSSFLTAAGGSFTRASVGTYYDSTGVMQTAASGAPRFDYDPVTHTAKGILIEEGRTNLFTYSSAFDDASWTKTNSTITPNLTNAPDGTLNADKLVENTSNAIHVIAKFPTYANSTTYQQSAYFKAAERSKITVASIGVGNTSGDIGTFDLSTGTKTSGQGTITPVGNDWYRITVAITTGAPSSSPGLRVYILDNSGNTNYTGDGVSGIYLWGAQAEQSTFPTSYIPTTTAAVTRGADNLTIPTTGGWFSAATGTFLGQFEEASALNTGGTSRIFGTSLSGRFAYRASGSTTFNIYDGTNVAGSTAQPQNSLIKISSSYGPAGLRISSNGTTPGTNTFSGTWGNQGYAWIATLYTGHISKYKYYPAQVSTTQLKLLSQ